MSSPDWIDRKAYPFETRYLDLEAGRMHYLDEGEGAPVVMVHGNPTWSFLYRHLVSRLVPGFRCVVPDHIGFGLSDKPTDWSYLPRDHSLNLKRLIETLGLKDVTLVVQDWGGPIGLSYAIAHPRNTAGLIIMNTWMWPVDRDWYYMAFSAMMGGPLGRYLIRRHNFFARFVMRESYGDKGKLTRRIHEHYLKPLTTPDERKGCSILPGEILGSTPWLRELWERRSTLAEKPALILWGMKDIAFREKELNTWTRLFPTAETVRMEGAGHYIQEEAPEEIGDAVTRFLDHRDARARSRT